MSGAVASDPAVSRLIDALAAAGPTALATESCIHLVTDENDKPFAVGFRETDRPGLVTWRVPLD